MLKKAYLSGPPSTIYSMEDDDEEGDTVVLEDFKRSNSSHFVTVTEGNIGANRDAGDTNDYQRKSNNKTNNDTNISISSNEYTNTPATGDAVAAQIDSNPNPNPNRYINPVTRVSSGRRRQFSSTFNQCLDPNCTTCPPQLHELRRKKDLLSAKSKKYVSSAAKRTTLSEELKFYEKEYPEDEEDETVFRRLVRGFKTITQPKVLRDGWDSFRDLLAEPIHPLGGFYKIFNGCFVLAVMLSFVIDPLFFFVVSVDPTYMCAYTNWRAVHILVVLRFLFDVFYLLHILIQFRLSYRVPTIPQKHFFEVKHPKDPGEWVENLRDIRSNYMRTRLLLDILAVLPFPQIMSMAVIPGLGNRPSSIESNLLRLTVFFQYIPRIMRCYPIIKGSDNRGRLFESAWMSFALNMVMYVMSSHIIGSIWYLGSVQRWNECAQEACTAINKNETWRQEYGECQNSYFYCPTGNSSHVPTDASQYNFSQAANEYILGACGGKFGGELRFNYGLFIQAIHLVLYEPLITKYIYSLQWGFTQISTLGGNQIPSYFIPEIFFMLTITAGGLLLFAVLIGNIQSFLQSLTRRTFEYQLQRRDVEKWMSRRNLPYEVATRVRRLGRLEWSANQGVDDTEMLSGLSEDLQRDIRSHLCLDLIKKSEFFSAVDNSVKDTICKRLIFRIYPRGTEIFRSGDLVDRMFFVQTGELERIYSDRNRQGPSVKINAGEFFGEELLIAYLEDVADRPGKSRRALSGPQSGMGVEIFPRSEETIKCVDNVEGFALEAADLDFICKQFKASFVKNDKVQRALNKCSHLRRSRAAQTIQLFYRYYLRRRLRLDLKYMELVKSHGIWGKAVRFAIMNPGKVLKVEFINDGPRNLHPRPPHP